ncbi:hypothetical protein BGX26_002022, partial [Mortierella sp. AD094]
MVTANSFITFHDVTPQMCVLWASPSVYDVMGYEPEEAVGLYTTDLIVPDCLNNSSVAINENIKNDLAATQLINSLRHKDGHPVHLLHVITTCYDFMVNCSTMIEDTEYE